MQAANAVQFNPVEIKLNVSRATFPTEAPKAARLGEMVCRRLSPNQGSPGGAEHTQLAPGPGTALGTPNRTSGPGRVMLCEGHPTMFAPGSHSAVAAKVRYGSNEPYSHCPRYVRSSLSSGLMHRSKNVSPSACLIWF
jgi:hypothetical protein